MSNIAARNPSTVPLPVELRSKTQAVLDKLGPAAAAARLRVSVNALCRACSGQPVRMGTHALLTLAFANKSGLNPVVLAAAIATLHAANPGPGGST
jgi:hypothetical protein